ncbi:MAG: hypothetical protein NTY12_01120 [Candidatus Falkowbacteria bacterium]|nr:hypothetical protein [Candidatus Falkowbacteria bacterium]
MAVQVKDKKILVSLIVSANLNWREDISKLKDLGINELALFVESFTLDQRKELYRLLESSGIVSIPYVQISNNFEEGELDYFITNHGTQVFGLALNNSTFSFISTLTKFASLVAPENPTEDKYVNLFTDESLSHSNVSGVCLDIMTLEYDRLFYKKKYQSAIHALDHHPLLATQIGPVPESWLKKSLRLKSRRLTTLTDLHYLKNIPKTYLADLLVLDLKNSLEEQLEIKAYLELMLK